MFDRILIDNELLQIAPGTVEGSHSFMVYNEPVQQILKEKYGRDYLGLKYFKKPMDEFHLQDPSTYGWGKAPILDTTKIQNLFAFRGMAPRVYDLVIVNGYHMAQVTEFVEIEGWRDPTAVYPVLEEYGIDTLHINLDLGERNWRGIYLVDFSGWHFVDTENYLAGLQRRARTQIDSAHRGMVGNEAYQALDTFNIPGQRQVGHRVEVMGLDDVDFHGKTVLDIGCNLGQFCIEANRRGAKRVTGIDREYVAKNTREIMNWLGYWNTDIVGMKLPAHADDIEGTFDIVFALSVFNHVGGYAPWMVDLCDEIMYIEGHGGDKRERFEPKLKEDFRSVEFLGYVTDNHVRPVWRCAK